VSTNKIYVKNYTYKDINDYMFSNTEYIINMFCMNREKIYHKIVSLVIDTDEVEVKYIILSL
jgi:hypothetical protein